MTFPSILLGLVCALFIGALFHLWVDGGAGRLVLYLGLSVIGFAAGQWLGGARGLALIPLGPLDLGAASLGSLILLGVGHWLSLVEIRRPGRDDKV